MNINTIENEIIAQLQSDITDLKIEGFPDNPAQYKLIHPKGAILVHFLDANYNKPEENIFIQQAVNLEFALTLIIKGLRDKNGAYSYIESVISSLTGFNPTDCGKIYPVKVEFLREDNGIWQYTFTFSVPTENYNN
ncbi:MAG TPA: Gp37 family protein [Candidatus Gastranaerophilales bacterium]|nr:Gp37 family protein [Candidatus Gastranaerophilales bacterium]